MAGYKYYQKKGYPRYRDRPPKVKIKVEVWHQSYRGHQISRSFD